jgi:hypothetical protein
MASPIQLWLKALVHMNILHGKLTTSRSHLVLKEMLPGPTTTNMQRRLLSGTLGTTTIAR